MVRDVVVRFGGVIALNGVSFDVAPRQICGLIGPNGSGKTTLFNCISGFYRDSPGEIRFEDRVIAGAKRPDIVITHSQRDLPIILAGGAAGRIAGGRYLKFAGDETPLTNLYLTMLDKVGVPTEKLGDSTGRLNRLEV